jgi:hypothetical protein
MTRIAIVSAGALVLAFVAAVGTASAQLAPRDQLDPSVSYMADREQYLIAWTEDRGAGHRVFAKRLWANGLPVGGVHGGSWELTGAVDPAGQKGDQRWPALVDGLVVWSEKLPGAPDYDIYAQRRFTNDRTYGKPMLIVGGPGDQKYPAVAPMGNGDWLIVYSEDTTDAGDVKGIRINAALAARSAAFPVAQGPGTAEDPTIGLDVANPNYFLVFWTDDRNGNKDIFGSRIAKTGLPRGTATTVQFSVIASPDDEYAADYVVSQRDEPRAIGIGSSLDSRNLLLWTVNTVNDGPNVMGQRLHANAYPIGASFLVAGGMGNQGWPAGALRTDPVGSGREEWLVVWTADALGTLDVMGKEVGLNGIARRAARVLATD